MDPLTAALNLAAKIVELIILTVEAQPLEVRAEYAKAQLEDFQKWRKFLEKLGGGV